MKSFLAKSGVPIIPWGSLKDGLFYEGIIPDNYQLLVAPSDNYIILDIDNKPNKVNGIDNIPTNLYNEIFKVHFNYPTKSGYHSWMLYTGDKILLNKTTSKGLDLRCADGKYAKGYVRWYLSGDIRNYMDQIKPTSLDLNIFLESLFTKSI